jgi:hypothetical protein
MGEGSQLINSRPTHNPANPNRAPHNPFPTVITLACLLQAGQALRRICFSPVSPFAVAGLQTRSFLSASVLFSPFSNFFSFLIFVSYNRQFVVQSAMRSVIQARLDDRSRKRLSVLVRALGWTPSQVVREGLRLLEATHLRRKKQGIIGLGKFRSGVSDLGSSKKHLRGFGR